MVPYGSFDYVLETKEWTPLEPGFSEEKYYARGAARWVIRGTWACWMSSTGEGRLRTLA